ncbi:helix-turn-helix domain-containing protein [Streptomyces parvulus]|uniref:helix-turn-helix domain-containing protein n=1 Tax=Streptomyces parvulus TaxID=146923 RepID=UPI00378BB58B
MTNDRTRSFGDYLAALRRGAGLSQNQMAARLCLASGTASVTRSEVSRWERGVRVPGAWLPFLAQVLAVPHSELRQAAAYARGDDRAQLPVPSRTLADLLPDGERLTPGESGRHLGAADVAELAGRAHALRLADDVLSGGDLIGPAYRELHRAVDLYRNAVVSEATGQGLLVQIGELGQIVGWIASDAGRLADAEHAYRIGIDAARQAGDTTLAANVAGSLAYQWSNNGRTRDGVALAEAAAQEAGGDAPPVARALFLDRVAWAHTRAEQPQPAMRALAMAHEALSEEARTPAPDWAYWVDRSELEVMDARVFTELRRPLRAVPLLTRVLGQYAPTHAREMALYRSWLAVALADANEPEQAAEEARRVVALSGDLASERTADRARVVLARLREYEAVPEVDAVLRDHGHLLLT